jgi:hypothetical protein
MRVLFTSLALRFEQEFVDGNTGSLSLTYPKARY